MTTAPAGADSIYFLMFGGWARELRSNRWHWATRWARELPVVLVQPATTRLRRASAEPETRIPNCEILTISADSNRHDVSSSLRQAAQVVAHMRTRDHRRPLLWCYSPRLAFVYAAVPAVGRIYHATENYFEFEDVPEWFTNAAQGALSISDAVLSVSRGVSAGVRPYSTGGVVIESSNGCDTSEYRPDGPLHPSLQEQRRRFDRLAVYAGNVNGRLDFPLLLQAADRNPRTLIALFGPVEGLSPTERKQWQQVLQRTNVRYYGTVSADELPSVYRTADVGLIAYKRSPWLVRNGFPLKALEMGATGLPVVSTLMEPIAGLARALSVTRDDEEFLEAFRTQSRGSIAPSAREELARVCSANDYDVKFAAVHGELLTALEPGTLQTRIDRLINAITPEAWSDAMEPSTARWQVVLAWRFYLAVAPRVPATVRGLIPLRLRRSLHQHLAS